MKIDKIIETISYNGASFEVVERPEVLWVGKIAYATNLTDEPDIGKLLNEYRELLPVAKLDRINPDWDAAISIDYWRGGAAPRGMMFAQETTSEKQDSQYDIFKMPASLFMRILNNTQAAQLLNKDTCELWEFFCLMNEVVMPKYGYQFNENGAQEIEYCCHKDNIAYAYVPIIKAK